MSKEEPLYYELDEDGLLYLKYHILPIEVQFVYTTASRHSVQLIIEPNMHGDKKPIICTFDLQLLLDALDNPLNPQGELDIQLTYRDRPDELFISARVLGEVANMAFPAERMRTYAQVMKNLRDGTEPASEEELDDELRKLLDNE